MADLLAAIRLEAEKAEAATREEHSQALKGTKEKASGAHTSVKSGAASASKGIVVSLESTEKALREEIAVAKRRGSLPGQSSGQALLGLRKQRTSLKEAREAGLSEVKVWATSQDASIQAQLAANELVLSGSLDAALGDIEEWKKGETEAAQKFLAENVELSTGEFISKESYTTLSPEDQKYIKDNGTVAFKSMVEERERVFEAEHVKLQSGEWVPKAEYDKLPEEERVRLDTLGVGGYNAAREADKVKFESENVQLGTGEWINKAEYDTLPADVQSELYRLGVVAFNASQEEYKIKFESENVKLDTDEWISKVDYEALPEVEQAELKRLGFDAYNALQEQKKAEFEASNILLSTGEYLPKTSYDSLSPEDQALVVRIGVTDFNAQQDKERADFESTHTLLDDGEYIPNDAYNTLSVEDQAELKRIGIVAFNTLQEQKQIEFESTHVKLANDEWVDKAEYEALPAEERQLLNGLGIEAYVALTEEKRLAFEAANVKLTNGEWVDKVEYDKLAAEDQARLNEIGVVAFKAEMDAAKKEFEAENLQLSGGEWIDRDDFNALSIEDQTLLNSIGITAFKTAAETRRVQFEADNVLIAGGEYIPRSEYNALTSQEQSVILSGGIAALNAFREGAWEMANVRLATGEYIPRDQWQLLSPADQASLSILGIAAYQAKEQEEYDRFVVDNIEVRPGDWVNRNVWNYQLSEKQRQEYLATGSYHLSASAQFNEDKAAGLIPYTSFYSGENADGSYSYYPDGPPPEAWSRYHVGPEPEEGTVAWYEWHGYVFNNGVAMNYDPGVGPIIPPEIKNRPIQDQGLPVGYAPIGSPLTQSLVNPMQVMPSAPAPSMARITIPGGLAPIIMPIEQANASGLPYEVIGGMTAKQQFDAAILSKQIPPGSEFVGASAGGGFNYVPPPTSPGVTIKAEGVVTSEGYFETAPVSFVGQPPPGLTVGAVQAPSSKIDVEAVVARLQDYMQPVAEYATMGHMTPNYEPDIADALLEGAVTEEELLAAGYTAEQIDFAKTMQGYGNDMQDWFSPKAWTSVLVPFYNTQRTFRFMSPWERVEALGMDTLSLALMYSPIKGAVGKIGSSISRISSPVFKFRPPLPEASFTPGVRFTEPSIPVVYGPTGRILGNIPRVGLQSVVKNVEVRPLISPEGLSVRTPIADVAVRSPTVNLLTRIEGLVETRPSLDLAVQRPYTSLNVPKVEITGSLGGVRVVRAPSLNVSFQRPSIGFQNPLPYTSRPIPGQGLLKIEISPPKLGLQGPMKFHTPVEILRGEGGTPSTLRVIGGRETSVPHPAVDISIVPGSEFLPGSKYIRGTLQGGESPKISVAGGASGKTLAHEIGHLLQGHLEAPYETVGGYIAAEVEASLRGRFMVTGERSLPLTELQRIAKTAVSRFGSTRKLTSSNVVDTIESAVNRMTGEGLKRKTKASLENSIEAQVRLVSSKVGGEAPKVFESTYHGPPLPGESKIVSIGGKKAPIAEIALYNPVTPRLPVTARVTSVSGKIINVTKNLPSIKPRSLISDIKGPIKVEYKAGQVERVPSTLKVKVEGGIEGARSPIVVEKASLGLSEKFTGTKLGKQWPVTAKLRSMLGGLQVPLKGEFRSPIKGLEIKPKLTIGKMQSPVTVGWGKGLQRAGLSAVTEKLAFKAGEAFKTLQKAKKAIEGVDIESPEWSKLSSDLKQAQSTSRAADLRLSENFNSIKNMSSKQISRYEKATGYTGLEEAYSSLSRVSGDLSKAWSTAKKYTPGSKGYIKAMEKVEASRGELTRLSQNLSERVAPRVKPEVYAGWEDTISKTEKDVAYLKKEVSNMEGKLGEGNKLTEKVDLEQLRLAQEELASMESKLASYEKARASGEMPPSIKGYSMEWSETAEAPPRRSFGPLSPEKFAEVERLSKEVYAREKAQFETPKGTDFSGLKKTVEGITEKGKSGAERAELQPELAREKVGLQPELQPELAPKRFGLKVAVAEPDAGAIGRPKIGVIARPKVTWDLTLNPASWESPRNLPLEGPLPMRAGGRLLPFMPVGTAPTLSRVGGIAVGQISPTNVQTGVGGQTLSDQALVSRNFISQQLDLQAAPKNVGIQERVPGGGVSSVMGMAQPNLYPMTPGTEVITEAETRPLGGVQVGTRPKTTIGVSPSTNPFVSPSIVPDSSPLSQVNQAIKVRVSPISKVATGTVSATEPLSAVSPDTSILTRTRIQTRALQATSPFTKEMVSTRTQTQTKVKVGTTTSRLTRVRTGAGGFIPLPWPGSEKNEQPPVGGPWPRGTAEWKMGLFWKVIPPPYDQEKPYSYDRPIPGSEHTEETGPGSAYRTMQIVGGPAPISAEIDLGVVDVEIEGGSEEIKFKGGGLKTSVGGRSKTSGMRVKEAQTRRVV